MFFLRLRALFILIKGYLMGGLVFFRKGLFFNYCIENNSGDSFNYDFLNSYLQLPIRKYTFGKKNHFLFCGSILGRSNSYSTIVGAGFISQAQAGLGVDFYKVVGLRGFLSKEALEKSSGKKIHPEFLGDPGLLAREVVSPAVAVNESGPIGVIPHFIHLDKVRLLVSGHDEFLLIDIKQPYDKVCNEIKKCSAVLSSSLHGLVFSDSMNVPNSWVSFGSGVKGGRFKFHDYYSVMTNPRSNWVECSSIEDLYLANKVATVSENPNYKAMKSSIDNAFKGGS